MKRSRKFLVRAALALLLALGLGSRPAGAAPNHGLGVGWPADPAVNVAVRDTLGAQTEQAIVSDAGGGAFFVWKEGNYEDRRILRLDARGSVAAGWPSSGINLTIQTMGAFDARVARSAPNSVIVVWEERLNADQLRAQKIDTSGVLLWPTPGVSVCDGIGQLEGAVALPDGGVLVVYSHDYGYNVDTAFVMRIDPSGQRAWPQPRVLCDAVGQQYYFRTALASDSEFVALWVDGRKTPGFYDPQAREIYAQKLLLDGTEAWPHNGKRMLPEWDYPGEIRANGYGGFVAPILFNGSLGDLKLLNIDKDGDPMPGWPDSGLVVAADPTKGEGGGVSVSPTDGSTLVVWSAGRQLLKALKIDLQGNILWPNGGIALYDSTVQMEGWNFAPDGEGGAFVTMEYPRSDADIIVQHVRADGTMAWPGRGVQVTNAPRTQSLSQLDLDLSSGVFVGWQDWRHAGSSSDPDFYAQHVNADGSLGGGVTATAAAAIVAAFEDGCARVVWRSSGAASVQFTVQRRLGDGDWSDVGTELADGTGSITHRDCDLQPSATYAYRLEWIDDGTPHHSVPISLTTTATSSLALALPAPNPITTEASVEFTLPSGAHVRLEVLDLAGRRVATIFDGNEAAGVHRLAWRPAADGGGRLAPGCYVLRLSSENQTRNRRVVFLR